MKKIVAFVLALSILSLIPCALADAAWPAKTVTFKVAANAGGGTDNFARVITACLQKATGEAFTVVNDSTGNGTVAFESVRNAAPDGYTLLFYHSTMGIQYYQGAYGYNPADEANFTVIANVPNGGTGDVLCVSSKAPYKTFAEFAEYCKNNMVFFGNQNGGFGQLEFLLLNERAQLNARFVDAGGQADTIISLLGGNIDACFIGADAAAQYAEAGDMICLGLCDSERSSFVPDVPTFTELGYDVVFKPTMIVLGPANMDPALVEQINAVFAKIAEDPETLEALGKMNMGYTPYTAAEAREIWVSHVNTIKEVCGLAGYDVENK